MYWDVTPALLAASAGEFDVGSARKALMATSVKSLRGGGGGMNQTFFRKIIVAWVRYMGKGGK